MKKYLLLVTAVLAVLTFSSRSRATDPTAPASTANGSGTPASPAIKPATPARIAHGAEVNIQDYVVAGKTTIFDFTSQGCPPCRAIAPYLHKLHAERADIVVVEVDLNRPGVGGIDWESPVARQYGMNSIPHFKIYGPDGQLKAEGQDAYTQVRSLLK